MKLNVSERLTLVRTLPQKGSFHTMKTIEKLQKALYLSEEENEEFGIVVTDEQIKWNDKGKEGKEIEISELGMQLLIKALEEIDKKEELSIFQFQVFSRIKQEQEEKEKVKETGND